MYGLPELCFVVLPTTKEVVMVHRGEMGYSPTREGNLPWYGQETADVLNGDLGTTKAQVAAMFVGSMFGWDVPGANPDTYDENGKHKRHSNHLSQGKHK